MFNFCDFNASKAKLMAFGWTNYIQHNKQSSINKQHTTIWQDGPSLLVAHISQQAIFCLYFL